VQDSARREAAPNRKAARTRSKKSPASGVTIGDLARTLRKTATRRSFHVVAKEVEAAFGHLRVEQMTPMMPLALAARWRKEKRPSTTKNYLFELRRILEAVRASGGPRVDLPKPPTVHARAVTASMEELVSILKEPPAWLRLYLLLYFQCGLRAAETLRVTPRNWNAGNRTVTIPIKGGGTRTLKISEDVEALLTSAGNPEPDQPYIWALRGKNLTLGGLRRAWESHKKKCRVNPAVTSHDLRRTAATIVYNDTKDLRAAQELLGHKNLASTLSYLAPLHPDEAQKYAELLRFEHFKSEVKQ
jgi:integrase/recombinase XerC